MLKILFTLALIVGSNGAWACKCPKEAVAERYAHAFTIIRVQVVATSLEKNPRAKDEPFNPNIVRAKVNILETLKGAGREPSSVEGVANYQGAVCNIALVSGAEYLFVLESTPVVSSCNSWFLDGNPAGEKILQQFRSLKEGR